MQWTDDGDTAWNDAAIGLARRAVDAQGDTPKSWLTLHQLLRSAGETAEADAVLTRALAAHPRDAALHLRKARQLKDDNDDEGALAAARTAFALAPQMPRAATVLFEMLIRTRRDGEAAPLFETLTAAPPITLPMFVYCERNRDAQAMLALAERALYFTPGHAEARYRRAMALAALGRADEASAALPLDEMLSVEALDNDAAFHAALEAEIRRNPTLVADPNGKATLGGQQTRRLRQPDAPTVERLLAQIRRAVARYAPRFEERPDKVHLNSWAVVYDHEGRQLSHRHPTAWISGVYYVLASHDGGALLYGAVSEHGPPAPWPVRAIAPEPGRLVLFPSYAPHATEPARGARISVAFDVTPAG